MIRRGAAALVLAGAAPAAASAQQPATGAPSFVFEEVTIVDVEQGKLVPARRVVITGNRIQAVGAMSTVKAPKGAQVIEARGKYLIPGLWDMHVHPDGSAWPGRRPAPARQGDNLRFYPAFIAYGVTGIRTMSGVAPLPGHVHVLDSVLKSRREILAGQRVGPRIIASVKLRPLVRTPADARRLVDSLQAAGADFIKLYDDISSPEIFFVLASEARRVGVMFGGHGDEAGVPRGVTLAQASDSGMRTFEHIERLPPCTSELAADYMVPIAVDTVPDRGCVALAQRMLRNNTWLTPTQVIYFYLLKTVRVRDRHLKLVRLMHRAGVPMLAGTDVNDLLSGYHLAVLKPGFSLHEELQLLAQGGLSPVEALRTATLNPAKMLRATDSLGTVAPGKLADLVLLDADPLQDITNTQKIHAVVANGRYFDRAALDGLREEGRRWDEWHAEVSKPQP